jgi:threonyl-tRNA synthetase
LWLAPIQAVAINISEKHAEKSKEITEILEK